MRKDYIIDSGADGADEIAFIERFWTDIWRAQGGPKGVVDKLGSKPEYRVMAPYLARMPKGARLLDGGCGLGDWTLFFSRRGHPTLGLDISRATVAKLNELFPEGEFVLGDIRHTGLPDDSFDAYFSWGVFEHFEDGCQACIAEAYRVIKPGGHLFITVPFDNARHGLRAAWDRRQREAPDGASRRFYQWRFTRGEIRRELAMGGFEVLEIKPIHKWQGSLRMLHDLFGLPHDWLLSKGLAAIIRYFMPAGFIAHMIIVVARKPEAPGR